MKFLRLFAVTAIVFFSLNVANAQTEQWVIGIKAGANYTDLYTDLNSLKDETGKAGFTIGAFARMGQELFFQPEINYIRSASKFEYDNQTLNPKFNQLNVPLMIGYKLLDQDYFNLRVSVGPDLNYSLNEPKPLKSFDYKKFTVGGTFDVGVDLGNIAIDARYSRGFTDLNKVLGQKAGIYSLTVGFKVL